MGISCGIVGLPNVGKSTLFNALTAAKIEAANYPFCTIEPNTGIVNVPDERIDTIAKIVDPEKTVGAIMEFVDIAGLVTGASQGEGLGNQFLANIRETDAIAHVVRCFEDDNIVHVANRVDPIADITTINTELMLADLQSIEKSQAKMQRNMKAGDKVALKKSTLLTKLADFLNTDKLLNQLALSVEEKQLVQEFHLLTIKPMMYIANVDEKNLQDNKLLQQLTTFATEQNSPVVPISASLEAEIAQLNDEEKLEFLQDIGQKEPSLHRVISKGYELLNLQTYFTAGKKEVRAWTIKINSTAPQAAGIIHTDFAKGFIRVEVMSYDDFISLGGEMGCKEKGKLRVEGKEYVVQDGDILHFRFNV